MNGLRRTSQASKVEATDGPGSKSMEVRSLYSRSVSRLEANMASQETKRLGQGEIAAVDVVRYDRLIREMKSRFGSERPRVNGVPCS